ncbi:MAG: fasciclin domain-containing protein [Planctomycetota bacterium]
MNIKFYRLYTLFTVVLSVLFLFASYGEAQSVPSPVRDGFGSPAAERGWFVQKLITGFSGMPNLVEKVDQTGTLSTLLIALDAADLTGVLEGPGPFTIFAPNDEAFDRLPSSMLSFLLEPRNKKRLQQILKYHVVPGKYMAADVLNMTSAPTLNGQDVNFRFRGSHIYVQNAEVLEIDLAGSNGVIHVIDTVMIPPLLDVDPTFGNTDLSGSALESNITKDTFIGSGSVDSPALGMDPNNTFVTKDIVDTAMEAGAFDFLVRAVQSADLVAILKSKGPYTVFAPTDDAFRKLGRDTLRNLLDPNNKALLASIVAYHVVPGEMKASDVMKLTSAPTLNGQSLDIMTRGNSVKVNDAGLLQVDIRATNGIIHVIDTVLIPD